MASREFARELLKARSSLFGFILSMVRKFDLAEDLFQEVSVRILEREDSFEPGTNFGAWAREFARRTILEDRRGRKRLVLSNEAVSAVADHFDASDEEVSSQRQALRQCMQEVDDKARHMITLRYESGLSMSDVSRELGRTSGAVQVALSRVRSWLAECIQRRVAAGSEA